jgi:hypothetical protein
MRGRSGGLNIRLTSPIRYLCLGRPNGFGDELLARYCVELVYRRQVDRSAPIRLRNVESPNHAISKDSADPWPLIETGAFRSARRQEFYGR